MRSIGPRRCSMIDPTGIGWKVPTAVSKNELEVRMIAQHATKDQMMNGNGGIQRISYHIDQIVVGEAPRIGKTGRVHKDQKAQLLDAGKNLLKPLG